MQSFTPFYGTRTKNIIFADLEKNLFDHRIFLVKLNSY